MSHTASAATIRYGNRVSHRLDGAQETRKKRSTGPCSQRRGVGRPRLRPESPRLLREPLAFLALSRLVGLDGGQKQLTVPWITGSPADNQVAEAITHPAFYAGWPAAMSAVGVLASVTGQDGK